jgi:predicted nucleotidyltransferase component of viral defense system
MYHVIHDIFSSEYATSLAFKGGTLCYFVHRLDRFSTDIDIDLIAPLSDETIFMENMESILKKYGKVKEKSRKRHTLFFLLSYGESDMNIKIEINTRIWKANTYELVNFFGMEILAQDRSTIFANKLVAITDRSLLANRDLYDVYFFFKNLFPLNEAVILERTGKNAKEYLAYLLDFLEKKSGGKNILE